jgi:hypothetical protein
MIGNRQGSLELTDTPSRMDVGWGSLEGTALHFLCGGNNTGIFLIRLNARKRRIRLGPEAITFIVARSQSGACKELGLWGFSGDLCFYP